MLQEWLETGSVEMTLNNNGIYELGELLNISNSNDGKPYATVQYRDGRVLKVDFAEFDRWQGMTICNY